MVLTTAGMRLNLVISRMPLTTKMQLFSYLVENDNNSY